MSPSPVTSVNLKLACKRRLPIVPNIPNFLASTGFDLSESTTFQLSSPTTLHLSRLYSIRLANMFEYGEVMFCLQWTSRSFPTSISAMKESLIKHYLIKEMARINVSLLQLWLWLVINSFIYLDSNIITINASLSDLSKNKIL